MYKNIDLSVNSIVLEDDPLGIIDIGYEFNYLSGKPNQIGFKPFG